MAPSPSEPDPASEPPEPSAPGDLARQLAVALGELAQVRAVLDALTTGIVLYDAQDRLVLCNAEFRRLYPALGPHLVPGASFEGLMRLAIAAGEVPAAAADPESWLAERLRVHRNPQGPMTRPMADGHWRHIVEQRMADGGHLAHSVDVTALVAREQELARLNAELERLSDTDPLTGVANRRRFDRTLAEETSRAARHGMPLTLLLLDIDHFKAFNDRHGHPAGDVCLQRVAAVLKSTGQRPTDLLARVGGEEFVILLPHLDAGGAEHHTQRLQAALATAAIPHGASPVAAEVTLSIGMAEYRIGDDGAALLARADAALYEAKRGGRNRWVRAP